MNFLYNLCKPKKKQDLDEDFESIAKPEEENNKVMGQVSKPIKNQDIKNQLTFQKPPPQKKLDIQNDQVKQDCPIEMKIKLPVEQIQINQKIKVIAMNKLPDDQANLNIQSQNNLIQNQYNPQKQYYESYQQWYSANYQNGVYVIPENPNQQNLYNQQGIQNNYNFKNNQLQRVFNKNNTFYNQDAHNLFANQQNDIYQLQTGNPYSNQQNQVIQYSNDIDHNPSLQNLITQGSMESNQPCISKWVVDLDEYPKSGPSTNYSETKTCQITCYYCKNEISSVYIQLSCIHYYCQECLKDFLKGQVIRQKATSFSCLCGKKIKPQQVWDTNKKSDSRSNRDNAADMLKKQLFVNQAENIADQLREQKKYQKCSQCDFFVLKDNKYPSEFFCLGCGKNTN